jgi:hypothetical protein
VLISDGKLNALKDGETNPFECAVSFPVPVRGTGGIYDPSYYQSVLNGIKTRDTPLGGSKTGGMGHDDFSNDFYVIGGNVANGRANLRLLVPAQGYASSNAGLIRAIKAGVQQFSIVADPGVAANGHFTEELDIPRFDAVDQGAQTQTVYNSASESEIMALIENGAIDTEGDSDDLVSNGKVCRNTALRMQFNGPDKALGARVMNAIAAKLKSTGGSQKETKMADTTPSFTLEDAYKKMGNMMKNGDLTFDEIANALGKSDHLKKNADNDNAKVISALKAAVGLQDAATLDDLQSAIATVLKDNQDASEASAEVDANRAAGPEKLANGAENIAFVHAKKFLNERYHATGGMRPDAKKAALDALNADKEFIALKSQNAAGMGGASFTHSYL